VIPDYLRDAQADFVRRWAATILPAPKFTTEDSAMLVTIRNCSSAIRRKCPHLWERLIPNTNPTWRQCGSCHQRVYLCGTDEETVALARAGHHIAREEPTDVELGRIYDGLSCQALGTLTPEQADAHRRMERERAINDAIMNLRYSSRDCPRCHYPVPDYRVACRVCGFETGRVYDEDGNLNWANGPSEARESSGLPEPFGHCGSS
jgi:hypothetical protein